ncbi:ABC transporter ATP-binding protein [Fuerstiella marisgermanici]|uniref:Stage 0 sporulation protein KE n=1 Tax=Fuerstiella marisgermanici TaxID=1891926 RepID=A0A1P8WF55_9PLAN|nr:oligopeptide/dipeptide ABC transporter ATP-binding protein [Fuerstiella marisgermanici]APZ92673.1 Stage 0 sporulation protein KE [Fuerstiella marisgermanici]
MSFINVQNLTKHFPIHGGLFNQKIAAVQAVSDVSLKIEKGETLGVIGESGCGKSTLGKTMIRLLEPTAGDVFFDGVDVTTLPHSGLMPLRRRMQFIFQDPYSSLNPRMTAGQMLSEVIRFHNIVPKADTEKYVEELLDTVQLRKDAKSRYPHEFSGGQRQRLNIARALAVKPEFIIADEPVSALDVSVQAQILNLLMDLREQFGLTMMFISHDLKVVEHFCDRMIVMYLGTVVERIVCDDVYRDAKHPYTQALLKSNPINDPDDRTELHILEGEVPSPRDPPPGCPFVTRCEYVEDRCHTDRPPLKDVGDGHLVACWPVTDPQPAAS